MATVNEKMTQLANAIRSKSGTTGALSLDGMISAVNGITTGGGTTTYQLWGAHTFIPNLEDVDIGRFVGAYTVPQNSIYGWFYDYNEGNRWTYARVTQIEVYESGRIEIAATDWQDDSYCNVYDPDIGGWCDESDNNAYNERLVVYIIPNPTTVSKDIYDLFYALYDNSEYEEDAFGRGWNVGWNEGTSNGLEALGALCDWSVMVDSYSYPIIDICNLHPSYKLECTISVQLGGQDGWYELTYDIIVPPYDSISWSLTEEEGDGIGAFQVAEVMNVRWSHYE